MTQTYAEKLIVGTKMRWNILVNALAAGRTAKLNHMDVLEASKEKIVAGDRESGRVFMTFLAEDIMKPGVPQLTHFEPRYFNDKGVELKKLPFQSQQLQGLSR